MCWKLEFSKDTKLARNRMSCARLSLNIVGLILVLILGAIAAAFARYSSEWFPKLAGDDNVYKAIAKNDRRLVLLTESEKQYCNNSVDGLIGRYVYKCGSSRLSECISADFRCDGYPDCTDETDEISCDPFCDKATRKGVRFQCSDLDEKNATVEGKCFHINYKCDGGVDCWGEPEARHDESDCPDTFVVGSTGVKCSKDYDFVCEDHLQCIPMTNMCDGSEHCWDGSDEKYMMGPNGELKPCTYS